MKKILLLLSFCCAVTSGWAAEILSPAEEAAKRWKQYQPAFDAFAEQDRVTPFAPGGIVFVGSSIFRQWTTVPEQMAPLPVLNRAFGGSRTGDQLARFDQVVTPYAPKVIVYYCGSNDLKAGAVAEDPAAIFARFRAFSERVQATLPQTRIIFVSSTRSPDRVGRWEQVDHYNALARAYCAATPHRFFVDINPALVDASGHPRLDLYKEDKLHFHPPSYVEFTRVIRPVLEQVWAGVSRSAK
jgi:lysophospholipase L1-like esterase